eukprot:INCI11344.1.p1 GENE.INCI11344.1~~INCI11344.1.p1  ORF type:complete len:1337 (+),score=227.23 INCI11344.1:165-4175(+)
MSGAADADVVCDLVRQFHTRWQTTHDEILQRALRWQHKLNSNAKSGAGASAAGAAAEADSGGSSEVINKLLFGEASKAASFDPSSSATSVRLEVEGSALDLENLVAGPCVYPAAGSASTSAGAGSWNEKQSCVTDFISILANTTQAVLTREGGPDELKAREIHRLAAERQTWHLVQELLNVHATADASEFVHAVLTWLLRDLRPFHPRARRPDWRTISFEEAESIRVDDAVVRALAGPFVPFVQGDLVPSQFLSLNDYVRLINPYTDNDGSDDGSGGSGRGPRAGEFNSLVPPECWLGLENYQTLFAQPVDFPRKLWHLLRFTPLNQPQRENLLAILLKCDGIEAYRWLTFNIFGLDLSVREAALAIGRNGAHGDSEDEDEPGATETKTGGSGPADLNLEDGLFAHKFQKRMQALWRLKVVRDTEAVVRRMSWRASCVALADSWENQRLRSPQTTDTSGSASSRSSSGSDHTKQGRKWLEPVYHIFGGNIRKALHTPLLDWSTTKPSVGSDGSVKPAVPMHLVAYDRLWAATRGLFEALQEHEVDSAVASDPRLRPTGRSRRLRERVAAFQTAKRASHSQLKDTVAEFEAVLDDILEQMPPSPGFASSSSTSGAVASRTGSLARSETVGGGMVDLELQRQRSVLIKEDEAAHEWRAHLRTQVDLIRRLWRRFRDNNLVPVSLPAPGAKKASTPLPPSEVTASIVESLAECGPRENVAIKSTNSLSLDTVRAANYSRFRVNCLAVCAVLHCARRERQAAHSDAACAPGTALAQVPAWYRVAAAPNVRDEAPRATPPGPRTIRRWGLSGIGKCRKKDLENWIIAFRYRDTPGGLLHELDRTHPEMHRGGLAQARNHNPCVYTFLLPHTDRVRQAADYAALIRDAEQLHYDNGCAPDDSGLVLRVPLWTNDFVYLVRYGDNRDIRAAYARFQGRGVGNKFLVDFMSIASNSSLCPPERARSLPPASVLFLLDQFEIQATRLVLEAVAVDRSDQAVTRTDSSPVSAVQAGEAAARRQWGLDQVVRLVGLVEAFFSRPAFFKKKARMHLALQFHFDFWQRLRDILRNSGGLVFFLPASAAAERSKRARADKLQVWAAFESFLTFYRAPNADAPRTGDKAVRLLSPLTHLRVVQCMLGEYLRVLLRHTVTQLRTQASNFSSKEQRDARLREILHSGENLVYEHLETRDQFFKLSKTRSAFQCCSQLPTDDEANANFLGADATSAFLLAQDLQHHMEGDTQLDAKTVAHIVATTEAEAVSDEQEQQLAEKALDRASSLVVNGHREIFRLWRLVWASRKQLQFTAAAPAHVGTTYETFIDERICDSIRETVCTEIVEELRQQRH